MGLPIKQCSVKGCETEHRARGFCTKHYKRWVRYGDPLVTKRPNRNPEPKFCQIPDCNRRSLRHGCCHKHAYRIEHFGDPMREPDVRSHPLYSVWQGMRDRCTNPSHKMYYRYGGRGISVCERWQDFRTFRDDMGERPDGLTLERINNDGDYEPTNCRWATRKEQIANADMHWETRKRHRGRFII